MKTTFIYALCEPGTRTVRYVGKADNVGRRFKSHLKQSIKQKNHLGSWLRLLVVKNQIPAIVVLREVPIDQWQIAEERCIRLAKGCGMKLVNSTDGGEGITMTSEVLAKIIAKNTGKKRTLEQCAAIATRQLGRKLPPDWCEQISVSRKLAGSARGEKNPNFGKTTSDEKKGRIRAALLGKKRGPMSPEHRAAISRGNSGNLHSEVGRANNKAAQRLLASKELAAKIASDPEFGTRPNEIARAKRTEVQRSKREKDERRNLPLTT